MEERWLNLEYLPFEQTKTFVRALFDIDISDKITRFDKLEGKVHREPDPEMTVETYLTNMTEEVIIRYITGREEYIENEKIPAISLVLRDHFEKLGPTKFAWFFCPYNDENYAKLDRIFQESYGIRMSECKTL